MEVEEVYVDIQSQLDNELPFVVYRKPEEKKIYSILQQNDYLYDIKSYNDSGFIFSPFDTTEKAIIIPVKYSTVYCAEYIKYPDKKTAQSKKEEYFDSCSKAKKKHTDLIVSGIKMINSGTCRKIVLSRSEVVDFENKNIIQIFKSLVDSYPNAFVYCWYHPKIGMWLGATPETLAKVRENTFSTMALAGTQVYKGTTDVIWGKKELEEQKMVTEFVVQGLSSVATEISCSQTYTHKAGTLLHLRTDIEARIGNSQQSIGGILQLIHPTPAVCGLPKKEAKSFILENEGYSRKYYTGFLGELNIQVNKKWTSNLFVNLRCMEITGDNAILYVGGGITKESDPEKEWIETVRKTETMKQVLR